MSILRNFERRLESVVEGTFAKTFRSGLQPVELAKRILRDMEADKSVGVKNQIWVPNHYVFTLNVEDHARFAGAEGALIQELSEVVRSGARERGWSLMGPPQIDFRTDPKLKRGMFHCDAAMLEGTDAGAEAPAYLTMMAGDRHGQSYPLSQPTATLGRTDECEIQLADPAASRTHAKIHNDGGQFTLTDLGSTNGTMVNSAPIKSWVLSEGDRITIGQTTFEFRRG